MTNPKLWVCDQRPRKYKGSRDRLRNSVAYGPLMDSKAATMGPKTQTIAANSVQGLAAIEFWILMWKFVGVLDCSLQVGP